MCEEGDAEAVHADLALGVRVLDPVSADVGKRNGVNRSVGQRQVIGGLGPVLDPGVGPVPGFQER
jgi:hypothetical protein